MQDRVKRVGAVLAAWFTVFAAAGCGSEDPGSPVHEAASDTQLAGGDTDGQPASAPELIVLISVDTLRADHLGCYGYERFTSPILDGVAGEGVLFEDASTTAPWTLPSHASILTGASPARHGVVSMKTALPEDVSTLVRAFSENGWATAAAVNSTWLKREGFGLTRDFDDYLFVPDLADRRTPTTWVTDQALDWMKAPERERLFLFVHYYDVHADYVSEPAFESLFLRPYEGFADGSGWQLLQSNLDDDYLAMCQRGEHPDQCTFGTVQKPWVVDADAKKLVFEERDVAHLVDRYDAGIRQMDTELGRLFGEMRKAGLWDRALVVVTSDHGEEFMEHGRLDHFLPTWQELLHVPLIFHGPGVPAGVRVATPVSIIDIAPTLLSIAGVPAPPTMEGLDLVALMHGGDAGAFESRVLHGEAAGGLSYELVAPGYFPVYRSVREGSFKLVHDSKTGRYRLFDLASDPAEQHDVSEQHPEVLAELTQKMEARGSEPDARGGEPVQLSDDEIERLRALGYLK
jgi:arylsulfatase